MNTSAERQDLRLAVQGTVEFETELVVRTVLQSRGTLVAAEAQVRKSARRMLMDGDVARSPACQCCFC